MARKQDRYDHQAINSTRVKTRLHRGVGRYDLVLLEGIATSGTDLFQLWQKRVDRGEKLTDLMRLALLKGYLEAPSDVPFNVHLKHQE